MNRDPRRADATARIAARARQAVGGGRDAEAAPVDLEPRGRDDGVARIEHGRAADARALEAAEPAHEAAFRRERDLARFRLRTRDAVRPVVGEELRDRVAAASAGELAEHMQRAGSKLQAERTQRARARELAEEAAVAPHGGLPCSAPAGVRSASAAA